MNRVIIDGCNVAECEFLLSNYECMSNYKMIDCDGKITQFYKCKDCPNCYFKQLQKAKAEIDELSQKIDELADDLEKVTMSQNYYFKENEKLKKENDNLKRIS